MLKFLQYRINKILENEDEAISLHNIKKVKSTYNEFCMGKFDNSFFVWQWINMEEWFRLFIDNNAISKRFPLNN